MEPLVVYIFDHSSGHQSLMEKQLDKAGVERLPDQIPVFTWSNRIIRTMQIAEKYPDRLLCFVDAWDTLFVGRKWELESPCWEKGITFSSQKRCWPDEQPWDFYRWNRHWELAGYHTRWAHLNSNPMIGMGSTIAKAISWGWERFPLPGQTNATTDPDGNVCERFYTKLLFQAPREWDLRIDTQCALAQTVCESGPGEISIRDGRVYNLVTNTQPIWFHLNGGVYFDVGLIGEN